MPRVPRAMEELTVATVTVEELTVATVTVEELTEATVTAAAGHRLASTSSHKLHQSCWRRRGRRRRQRLLPPSDLLKRAAPQPLPHQRA